MSTFGESLYGGVIRCRKIIAQEADLPGGGGGGGGGTIDVSGINFDNKWSISLDNDSNFYLTNDLVNVVGLSGDAHTGKITLYDFKLDDIEDVDTTIKDFGAFMFYDSTQQKYEFTDKVRFLGVSLDVSSIPIVTSAGDLRLFNDDTSANIFLGGYTRNNPTLNGASIGIGHKAGNINNKSFNVAIGVQAGEVEQGKDFLFFTGEAIAIGRQSGQSNQEPYTIAIGSNAGNSNQNAGAISIGYYAGETDQSGDSIAIGNKSGRTRQEKSAIAIGALAGTGNQKNGAIAIGESCGYTNQGVKTIAIGSATGRENQNEKAIAIGFHSAFLDQSVNSIAIGNQAAYTTQNVESIAIGSSAGRVEQGKAIGSFIGESVAVGKQAGELNQQPHTIAIGSNAGNSNQEIGAISIGYFAGAIDQSNDSISIGNQAGKTRQDSVAIAIGTFAGTLDQGNGAIAIGDSCGYFNQGLKTIAIGSGSGRANQNEKAISIGYFSAYTDQSVNSIAIGNQAAYTSQNVESIAIGSSAGKLEQGKGIGSFIGESVAIGKQAGEQNQHAYAIAIGSSAGAFDQQNSALAVGYQAGATDQSANAVAIGTLAGTFKQKVNSIGIGTNAGNSNQGINSIGIGIDSALVDQGNNSIAIGAFSGVNSQGTDAISIGHLSGRVNQQINSIAIGHQTGDISLGDQSVAIGHRAGFNLMLANSVAIGHNSGVDNMGQQSVAVGNQSGENAMGSQAVAIGNRAGKLNLGSSSVAIGDRASNDGGLFASTIVINGTGTNLNPVQANSTYVKPIRSLTQAQTLHYDDGTGEITRTPNVSLTQGDNITITGTYPAFTIASTGGGGSSPAVFAGASISQTITGSADTSLNLWATQVANGINVAPTFVFTTPTAGWYLLGFSLEVQGTSSNTFYQAILRIKRNGINYHALQDNDTANEVNYSICFGGTILIQMAAGENITFHTQVNATQYLVSGYATLAKIDTTAPAPAPSLTASFRATSTNATNFTFTGGKQLLSAQLENVIGNKGSFNIGGAYNPATGLFTAPEDGVYSFYGSVFWQTSAFNAGYLTSYISTPTTSTAHPVNYALLMSQYGANEAFNANFTQIVSGIVSLTAGDSIGLYVFANNESLTANVSRIYSYFCGHRV